MTNGKSDWLNFEVIFEGLKLESKIDTLEKQTEQPGFWNDSVKAQKIMKEMNEHKGLAAEKKSLISRFDDLSTVIELYQESQDKSLISEAEECFSQFRQHLEAMELKLLLNEKYDDSNCYFSIHPGAGGTESQDWAQMLYRMYCRFFERRGYQTELLDFQPAEVAGIKNVTMLVKGSFSYGYMKCEKGVHRLVRISPFDSNARRHTSFASVDVFPEFDEEIDFEIRSEDLRVDTYRSGGAGGQHVNKTDSAVRITHLPTGIVVQCQIERSQIANRNTAMKMLTAKLYEFHREKLEQEMTAVKGEKKDSGWGNQIRSYVFQPYTLAKDHRTGMEMGNIQRVMDGDIGDFVKEYLLVSKGKKKASSGSDNVPD